MWFLYQKDNKDFQRHRIRCPNWGR